MCSRTVSDPANRLRKTRKKKSSAVPPFRSGHMSAICARLTDKGKVGVQRGRKTAGCPSFLPPPRARQRSRRPQTANPLAEVQRKTSRPLGANTLTQFARPGQPMQEKEPPRQSEPTAAVRVPQSSGAGKRSRPDGSHLPGQAVKFPLDIPQSPTTILLRKRSN